MPGFTVSYPYESKARYKTFRGLPPAASGADQLIPGIATQHTPYQYLYMFGAPGGVLIGM